MTLKQQILDDVKAAMKAREQAKLAVLRMLSAAIKQKEVDER
ncbi:MAG: GatB/YqeY domain-containing protein, partial [Limnobacter sp.]|nr:GatB/YqeY domain-containing protein [Limnobacter sp.]